jgi:hypothetical protein
MTITAEAEDDSINVLINRTPSDGAGGHDASESPPWREFIGQEFGWTWIVVNQQGYCDGVMLNFGKDIFPQLLLNVIASSITIGLISRYEASATQCC